MTNGSSSYDPDAASWNEADGIPWSDMTTEDLIAALKEGCSVEEAAIYLQYSEATIRAKMTELGLERKRADLIREGAWAALWWCRRGQGARHADTSAPNPRSHRVLHSRCAAPLLLDEHALRLRR
jgi:hypothetical protein